jgi:hypothetical protein
MRIGWVGGLSRNEPVLGCMAARAGHHLEFHSGDTGGRGASELKSLVDRADLVILITEVNSHNGVLAAKKLARQRGARVLVLRRCGGARFQQLLSAIAARDARFAAAS